IRAAVNVMVGVEQRSLLFVGVVVRADELASESCPQRIDGRLREGLIGLYLDSLALVCRLLVSRRVAGRPTSASFTGAPAFPRPGIGISGRRLVTRCATRPPACCAVARVRRALRRQRPRT